jgi:AraC-like DNA-binding protein
VAEKVGYATPLAFSAEFKRVRGISPQEHRASAPGVSAAVPIGAAGVGRQPNR